MQQSFVVCRPLPRLCQQVRRPPSFMSSVSCSFPFSLFIFRFPYSFIFFLFSFFPFRFPCSLILFLIFLFPYFLILFIFSFFHFFSFQSSFVLNRPMLQKINLNLRFVQRQLLVQRKRSVLKSEKPTISNCPTLRRRKIVVHLRLVHGRRNCPTKKYRDQLFQNPIFNCPISRGRKLVFPLPFVCGRWFVAPKFSFLIRQE